MSPQAFIFIGRSGCGKGTQVELLRPQLEKGGLPVLYVETGDKFREFIKEDGYSAKLSKDVHGLDTRQPDFLACYMWSTILVRDYNGDAQVIFDGTPRSETEARLLDTAIKFYKFEMVQVVHLDVSREWSQKHLLNRGRSDDATISKINTRLNWFDKDVIPAIEYLKNSDYHYVHINGEQTVEKVHADILNALGLDI